MCVHTGFSEFVELIARIAVREMQQPSYHAIFPTPFSKVCTCMGMSMDMSTNMSMGMVYIMNQVNHTQHNHVIPIQVLAMLTVWGVADLGKLEEVRTIRTDEAY